jgi:hypothetical protein
MPAMLVILMVVHYNVESVMKMWQLIHGFYNGFGTDASVLNLGFSPPLPGL